ncbi:hypothetical protein NSB1T_08895 [Coprobacter fastidiosus NSB1 = JCM 33896]|nr:hypothetical protein NSB1T_08895 [Coprobacter fastidiosus NSB1 = JCM 33896]PWM08547.1 MAG: hypothetical protein DBY02_03620 [Coprobacter fastidiosus]RHO62553.1 hypothetical protein DW107_00520 [Tannerella sp. AM09-19]RHS50066.1 hypothetical protein DWV37_01230 [Tannerella sp. AF04-6]
MPVEHLYDLKYSFCFLSSNYIVAGVKGNHFLYNCSRFYSPFQQTNNKIVCYIPKSLSKFCPGQIWTFFSKMMAGSLTNEGGKKGWKKTQK